MKMTEKKDKSHIIQLKKKKLNDRNSTEKYKKIRVPNKHKHKKI